MKSIRINLFFSYRKLVSSANAGFIVLLFLLACSPSNTEVTVKGKLFIIGGGKRPPSLIDRLVQEAGLKETGYGIILPMSSSEPDSAIFYALKQFQALSLNNVVGMNLSERAANIPQLDSIRQARMIYISGGDQNRFMKAIEGTEVAAAITEAHANGAIVAGTSAGAAMMSEVMITGDEKNYPEYSSTFRNIENENILTDRGLGLVKDAIIDQHFIKRSRYNRLISAVMDYPELMGIGIDESTAILVNGDGEAEVVGSNQVIVLRNPNREKSLLNEKMGVRGIGMDVLLPGDTFTIKRTK